MARSPKAVAQEKSEAATQAFLEEREAERSAAKKHAAEAETKDMQTLGDGPAVAVHNAQGNYVRTYSKEIHGPAFTKNAEEFAGKIGGEVRKVK